MALPKPNPQAIQAVVDWILSGQADRVMSRSTAAVLMGQARAMQAMSILLAKHEWSSSDSPQNDVCPECDGYRPHHRLTCSWYELKP